MSPNVNNFVTDLVTMAKALENEPIYQKHIDELESSVRSLSDTVQHREESILSLKAEIETLNSRIRTLEVDRDHAETMFLEADDRTARALDFIKATFGNAGSLIQALEPAKVVEPQPEHTDSFGAQLNEPMPPVEVSRPTAPEAQPTQPQGQSEPLPTSDASKPEESVDTSPVLSMTNADGASSTSPAPEVASAHPTVPELSAETGPDAALSGAGSTENASQPTTTDSTQASADQSFPMPPISLGRYSGKTYSAAKQEASSMWTWPDKDEWLSDGGTLDNFYA